MLTIGRSRRRSRFLLLLLPATAAVAWACDRGDAPVAPPPQATGPAFSTSGTCGASFTVITSETDSLMTPYGLGSEADTVNVCQTWTGSDYVWRGETVGSSEFYQTVRDAVQHTEYQNGSVTGFAGDGSQSTGPSSVGATAFDMVQADQATRDASADDPYYGVYSGGGGDCVTDCQQVMSRAPLAPSFGVVPGNAPQFRAHGLTRRGVRALVDDMAEIARSREGHRRFRKMRGEDEVILTLDVRTELLIGEESRSPLGTSSARHTWVRTPTGYVRDRSDVEATDYIAGRAVRSRAVIRFVDVKIDGMAVR
jgi:hypothetical protein